MEENFELKNPCDVCESKDDCVGCVLYTRQLSGKCCKNDRCFVNNEACGCLLSLDVYCKASTEYIEPEF